MRFAGWKQYFKVSVVARGCKFLARVALEECDHVLIRNSFSVRRFDDAGKVFLLFKLVVKACVAIACTSSL